MSGKEYTARTVEEALEHALNEMMLTRDDIEYEVVTQPSKGFLGFGHKDAVVRVKKKVIEELKEIVEDIKEERNVEKEPIVQKIKEESHEEVPGTEKISTEASEVVQEKTKEESVSEKETAPVVEVVAEVEEAVAEEVMKSSSEQKNIDKKVAFSAAEAKGREFLSKIFTEMKLDVEIDVKEKNGYLIFDLKGKNLGILIGRRGDTLDSLQFLLNLVINDKNAPKIKGIIDIENYRKKREETLINLSHKLAAKARKTGQKVVLEPMNPQ